MQDKRAQRWGVVLGLTVWAAGCAHGPPAIWVDELPPAALVPEAYRVSAGDTLSVLVWNQAKMSGDAKVRSDGQVTLPLIGDIAVQGLTPAGAGSQIEHRLEGLVVDPKVTVSIKESTPPSYSVVGEVKTSGVYPIAGNVTVLQAIAAAGGLSELASRDKIYVIRKMPELKRIRFTYDKLVHADGRGVLFVLRDGDTVVIE